MKQTPCEVLFGVDSLTGWLNVSPYKARKFIAAGMPCTRLDTGDGKTQWVFHQRAVSEWFYKKTLDIRPKNPDDAD